MPRLLRFLARCSAYLIALLLAAVWAVGALDTMTRPLFDLGRPLVGDTIILVAAALMLPSDFVMPFAQLLAGLKFMVGAFLFTALVGAIVQKTRLGFCDDSLLDVALFTAALASVLSALPGLMHGGALLQAAIGELMLCAIASMLAIYGRGYLIRQEIPTPVRPAFGYGAVR